MPSGLKRVRSPVALAALLASTLPLAHGKVFVFGDSYSDNGNLSIVTGGAQPGPDYWTRRFSNGRTAADRFAFSLTNAYPGRSPGLGLVQYPSGTSATGGVIFAHAGATAITRPSLPIHLSVVNQTQYFRDSVSAGRLSANSSDTAVIWAGANDYLVYSGYGTSTVAGTIVNSMVLNAAATGVGTILVFNLHNLGDLPGWIDGSRRSTLNTQTAAHNAALATRLAAAQSKYTARLVLVDVNRAISLAHQGLAGGFTVTRPGQNGSVSGNCLGDGRVLSNCPGNYLYYDYAHFSAYGHAYIASVAQDRFNSGATQPAMMALSAAGVGTAVGVQSEKIGKRFAALQGEDLTDQPSRTLGGLGFYSYGDLTDAGAQISDGGDLHFGGGADLRWGEWVAGAAAFQADPGSDLNSSDAVLSLAQRTDGVSAYVGWIDAGQSLTMSVSHTRGAYQTERRTTIMGLPVATGRADFSASGIEATASAGHAWGAWSLTGGAGLRYDDLRVDGFQETGTLGLSDTVYDEVQARGMAGRASLTLAYRDQDLTISAGAHGVTRIAGDAPLEAALPVSVPGLTSLHFDTGRRAPLALGEQAIAATLAAGWRIDDNSRFTFDAAGVSTSDGDIVGGVAFGAKVEF